MAGYSYVQAELDFGDASPKIPIDPELVEPDALAEALIATELSSEYLLSTSRNIGGFSHEIPAPSRLYQFPLEFASRERYGTDQSRLLLNHPDIGRLPFVIAVAEVTGVEPEWDPEDEFGRDRGELPRWWHAVDLMTEKGWCHLMETRHLTGDDEILRAVAFGVELNRISIEIARHVLGEMKSDEPGDRSEAQLLGKGIWPSHIVETHSKTGKKKSERWPINVMARGGDGAWLVIHGVEDGWFRRDRDGHLQMSPDGRARRGMDG